MPSMLWKVTPVSTEIQTVPQSPMTAHVIEADRSVHISLI